MKTIKTKLLTIAVLLCSISASAYDFEVDGIYYSISSIEELTVSVTSGDNKYSGEITIPEEVVFKGKTLKVTGIGNDAFYNCTRLTFITIPNSVTSIGDCAFHDCISLKELELENGTEELSLGTDDDNGLFYDCPLETLYLGRNLYYRINPFHDNETLRSVTIGNSVTSIKTYAFKGCSCLKELKIEDGTEKLSLGEYDTDRDETPFYDCPLETLYLGRTLSYYHYSPFMNKETLRSVTISDSVTEIGYQAFYNSSLASIIIPNSVTSIGEDAFFSCNNLTSITISNSVTSIGKSVFKSCSSLTSITIPNSVRSIEENAFAHCSSLTSITIPNSVYSIGEEAFYDCSSLTSITIPNSVTSIGKSVFKSCSSLSSITISNNVTNIKAYAFRYCSSLTSITIPNSVTSIGEDAFNGCDALTELIITTTVPPTVGSGNFDNSDYINMVVKVPEGSLEAYQAADVWKNFWDIQEDASLDIKNAVFETEYETAPIYNLQGVQMKEGRENLPAGIYIQGGKKMIVR